MGRTNIYLTEEQQKRLANRAIELGVSKSELIRRLLDEGLGISRRQARVEEALDASRGIWSDRTDDEIAEVLSWRRQAPLIRLDR
ncbi:MAG: CopG family transcriptional regulator [Acidimicrobiia bacterium]